MLRRFQVGSPSAGTRLDLFLAAACSDLSRSRIQKLIAEGPVRVGGAPARRSHVVRAGRGGLGRGPRAARDRARARGHPALDPVRGRAAARDRQAPGPRRPSRARATPRGPSSTPCSTTSATWPGSAESFVPGSSTGSTATPRACSSSRRPTAPTSSCPGRCAAARSARSTSRWSPACPRVRKGEVVPLDRPRSPRPEADEGVPTPRRHDARRRSRGADALRDREGVVRARPDASALPPRHGTHAPDPRAPGGLRACRSWAIPVYGRPRYPRVKDEALEAAARRLPPPGAPRRADRLPPSGHVRSSSRSSRPFRPTSPRSCTRSKPRRDNLAPCRTTPEVLYEGRHLVLLDRNGWEYVEHRTAPEAAMIVALTPEGGIVLAEEFRPPMKVPVDLVALRPGRRRGARRRHRRGPAGARRGDRPHGGELGTAHARPRLGRTELGDGDVLPRPPGRALRRPGGPRRRARSACTSCRSPTLREWALRREAEGVVVDPKIWAGLYLAVGR